MKLKMLTTAMLVALFSIVFAESAEAQQGRGRNGNGHGYNKGRHYAPRHAAPRVQHGHYRHRQNRQVVYQRAYYPPVPRYRRVVQPVCPPVFNNCYNRGYGNSVYVGNGGVSVNVNTPGFSGSFNSSGNYNGRRYRR